MRKQRFESSLPRTTNQEVAPLTLAHWKRARAAAAQKAA